MGVVIDRERKVLREVSTGKEVTVGCWDDLISYYGYLVNKGHDKYATSILRQVFDGEKFMSKLVENSQKKGLK